ncbi:MAG: signal peptide peptidase SppA [Candidatus Zixiibacteriota bacterium]
MARQRDIVIAIIIAVVFVGAVGFFGLMFIGMFGEDGGLGFGGFGAEIGVIELFGVIDEGSGRPVIKQLDKWRKNSSIDAIVFHINSPGGGVSISQEIYDAIRRVREEKPVVASMASVAASGGYYTACACDLIVANPGTITGSIGVIFQFHTAAKLLDKIGVKTETVKSGKMKDVGSYARDMTKQEEMMMHTLVMDTYEQFIEAIAAGREIEKDDIYPLADGSIYTGSQAFTLGLVDTLGGLAEAIEIAAELAEVEGEPHAVRPAKRKSVSVFDLFSGILGRLAPLVQKDPAGPQLLYLYQ